MIHRGRVLMSDQHEGACPQTKGQSEQHEDQDCGAHLFMVTEHSPECFRVPQRSKLDPERDFITNYSKN